MLPRIQSLTAIARLRSRFSSESAEFLPNSYWTPWSSAMQADRGQMSSTLSIPEVYHSAGVKGLDTLRKSGYNGPMKIAMIGTGYVGLVSGACLADAGNAVICVDKDKAKIDRLRCGSVPFYYEPGLSDIVTHNQCAGRLTFTTDADLAIKAATIVFIAVGTPSTPDGHADLGQVRDVATQIGEALNDDKIIVVKSTVPPGTTDMLKDWITEVSNGRAVQHRQQSGVPEGRNGRGRLHAAGPGCDRDAGPGGGESHADAVRPVHQDRGTNPDAGSGQRRDEQVRCERDAGHANLIHERDRESVRQGTAATSTACGR